MAFALDWLVVAAWIGAVALVGWVAGDALASRFAEASPWGRQLLGFTLLTLPVLLWFAAWEAGARGATPGKLRVGISVRTRDGDRLTLGRSLGRNALKFTPWELSHAALWRIPGWPLEVTHVPLTPLLLLAAAWALVGAWLVGALVGPPGAASYDRVVSARVVRVPGGRTNPRGAG
jgi:hypothetical protein